jgi:deoxyribonuclease NucA/NucB
MTTGPDQLAAQVTLALLLLLVVAGLLLTRMLRAIPGVGWVTLPFPGRGLLRRALVVLLLLVLVGLLLDALTGDQGRDGGRLPVFVVRAKRTPVIAAHVRAAQAAGKPAVLHRVVPVPPNRRPGACRGWRGPGSCDEYPFASTYEGGPGKASTAGVPLWENRRQGGDLLAFYKRHRIGNGDAFVVVVQ